MILSSFDHNSLRRLAEAGVKLPLGVLYSEPLWRPWNYAIKLGASALHPSLSATRAQDGRAQPRERPRGQRVDRRTSPRTCERVAEYGVDALITNHPEVARWRPATVLNAAG
jgi:glycerophosphoryl diester phosphodiesterase